MEEDWTPCILTDTLEGWGNLQLSAPWKDTTCEVLISCFYIVFQHKHNSVNKLFDCLTIDLEDPPVVTRPHTVLVISRAERHVK